MRFSALLPLGALVVFACNPTKETDTADATGPLEETHGHSSSQSGTATGGGPTGGTAPSDPTTTTATTGDVPGAPTTSATSTTADAPPSETTSTTGQRECEPELPDPGSCDQTFIVVPDLGEVFQCDLFIQTCPQGHKCAAWSSDGDSVLDSTRCVPIAPETDPLGAPCTVEGDGLGGVDSCGNLAMCWNVDAKTGIGTCVEQCKCDDDNPLCNTPNTACMLTNGGVLALCLPVCDPLDPTACARGEVCVPNPVEGRPFVCLAAADAVGQIGDPCESANACDPALTCGDPALLPELCDDRFSGCCVPFCDLSAADCPSGATCLPWHEPDEAPKCLENVGVCGVEP